MTTLTGNTIYLRALEPEDLEFIYNIENDEFIWEISHTQTPYSRFLIKQYLENAHQDIYEAKQYRFVICNTQNIPVGMIDLFDFNPQHNRVGVGMLILPENQGKGYGSEALEMIIDYAFMYLNVHQIFANITADNKKSIALFEKFNFKKVGIKKDWIFADNSYKDEILYQLIKTPNEF